MDSPNKLLALFEQLALGVVPAAVTFADETLADTVGRDDMMPAPFRMAFKAIYPRMREPLLEVDPVRLDELLVGTARMFLELRSDDAPSLEVRPVIALPAAPE